MEFDPAAEAAKLRDPGRSRRPYRTARLDRHAFEILAMRAEKASAAGIQRWLRAEKRIKVSRSTVARWLKTNGG